MSMKARPSSCFIEGLCSTCAELCIDTVQSCCSQELPMLAGVTHNMLGCKHM